LGLKRTTLQNKMKRLGIEKKKDYALIDTNGLWQLPPQQPTVAAQDESPPPMEERTIRNVALTLGRVVTEAVSTSHRFA
jgi:hypothetical protein